MPTDGGKGSRSTASPTNALKGNGGDQLDTLVDGGGTPHLNSSRDPGAFPKLKSPASIGMSTSPSPTNLRGPEMTTLGAPASNYTGGLSPVMSPRGVHPSCAQESVSVMVRLKGSTSPPTTQTSLASSSAAAPLLNYAVSDGTLKTPRTGRRTASRGSGAPTPRPHVDVSQGPSDGWQPTHGQPYAERSPLTWDDAQGGAAMHLSSSPLLAVTLPKALTSSTAVAATTACTPPSVRAYVESPTRSPVDASSASPSSSPLRLGGSSGCIGSRGRLLSLRSPTSDDYRQYEFGEVFEPDVTNAALCERVLPSITEQLRAGYNVCVLCYGQTGSGKTYTVNALAPVVAGELFRCMDADNEVIEMSYIQIYNNKAYNLLDGPRAGKFGAELSKPPQAANVDGNSSSSSSNNSAYGGAIEPKVLVRSAADVLAKTRAAARMRVTHAHALNPRSSRSFTLLTLHITRFLDGAALTTTRVTLADLAGTERLKRSGATGEGQSQAIFINKSLMALRELLESNNPEADVLHFRDSLLTTYFAPRMRSWHLFLLVTVSLEVADYDETKSSLDFATNARRRKIKKVKCRTADRLSSTAVRFGSGLFSGSRRDAAAYATAGVDEADMQVVVEALQYRVRVLEESLMVAQRQRQVLERMCAPGATSCPDKDKDRRHDPAAAEGLAECTTSAERLQQSEAEVNALRQECLLYRQLLREREDDLRSAQAQTSPKGGGEAAQLHLDSAQDVNGSFVSNAPCPLYFSDRPHHSHGSRPHPETHSLENGTVGEAVAGGSPQQQQQQQQQHFSAHSPLSTSLHSGDASPATAFGAPENAKDGTAGECGDDVHTQLLQGIVQLRHRTAFAEADSDSALEHLYDVALRAKEEDDDVRERLLVVTASLRGLRAQNRHLHDSLLRAHRAAVAQDEQRRLCASSLLQEQRRARAAEVAAEHLRLHLFRAYAEQPIVEELTRLYVDEEPSPEAVNTLSGTQLAEHREEVEKFESHRRALQDKITELVNTVEQLSRAGLQKDVSLATLESIITPAQRAIFHAMSTSRNDSDDALRQAVGEARDGESAADCFSLLQSRVAELELLLQQERQQHQLTSCEVVEVREDARRSRQEQRQAFFQQQEEERRVAQLTAENFDLRQQNERFQLYLDQVHVHFQEQLLELRRYHVLEMTEQHRLLEEAQQNQQQQQQLAPAHSTHGIHEERQKDAEEEGEEERDVRGFCQTSTRRGTSRSPKHASHDWTVEDTARGWASGPPMSSQRTNAMIEGWKRSNSTTLPQPPEDTVLEEIGDAKHDAAAPDKRKRSAKGRTKKRKGKSTEAHAKRSITAASPNSHAPSRARVFTRGRRSTSKLNSTLPPATRSCSSENQS